jgi:probable F420-dependent oxidoreductase
MSDVQGPPAIGITLFPTDRSIHPVELAREVEAREFESLFLPEHSHIPTSRRTPWPGARPGDEELPEYYRRMDDQIVALSMAAAVTERLVLGTAVTLVAQHDPIWLAKQVATLDTWSAGRVVLGVGFGWNAEQGEHHGVDHRTRRARTREHVAVMRALWTQDEASFHGEHVQLEPSWAWPKPAQPGGPPVLLGGGWGPKLFDAIADYGFSPPKISLTLVSSNTASMASAMILATESTSILSICFSGGSGSVLVMTTLEMREFFRRSMAGPGQHAVGGHGPHLGGAPLQQLLGGGHDGAAGVDHVVDEHAGAAVDVADDLRPRPRSSCP